MQRGMQQCGTTCKENIVKMLGQSVEFREESENVKYLE
jgi:hypothetical protein